MPRSARFSYPVDLTSEDDGAVNVSFPDLPEAHTFGEDRADTLAHAVDCLEFALSFYVENGEAVPPPSPAKGRAVVVPGALIAAKIALHLAMTEAGITNVALGRRLGVAAPEIRRMRDFRHNTKIDRLEAALASLGWTIDLTFRAA